MNTDKQTAQWVCEGELAFRPSDWNHRLAGMGAEFGTDQRLRYSPYLKPIQRNGRRCICLDGRMAEEKPGLYQTVLDFAHRHGLVLQPVTDGLSGKILQAAST